MMRVGAFVLALAAATETDSCDDSSDGKQRQQQERLLAEGTAQTGLPAIKNFRERKLLKAWQIWQGYHKGKISIPDVDNSVTRNLKLGNEMFPTIRPKDSVRESSLKKKARTFQHSRRDKDYVMVQIDKKKQENLKGESVEGLLDTLGRKAYQRLYVP